jgi:hypothetical protein
MRVRCIYNFDCPSLTMNNIYTVKNTIGKYYCITDDSGLSDRVYYKRRFEVVEADFEDIPTKPTIEDKNIWKHHKVEVYMERPMGVEGQYTRIAKEIGQLVDKKNAQYGDAINVTGDFLKLLFPNGIQPENYNNVAVLVRVFDKMKRIANGNQGEENAWRDICGYGLLMSKEDDF